jgi:hypothetical protein
LLRVLLLLIVFLSGCTLPDKNEDFYYYSIADLEKSPLRGGAGPIEVYLHAGDVSKRVKGWWKEIRTFRFGRFEVVISGNINRKLTKATIFVEIVF